MKFKKSKELSELFLQCLDTCQDDEDKLNDLFNYLYLVYGELLDLSVKDLEVVAELVVISIEKEKPIYHLEPMNDGILYLVCGEEEEMKNKLNDYLRLQPFV